MKKLFMLAIMGLIIMGLTQASYSQANEKKLVDAKFDRKSITIVPSYIKGYEKYSETLIQGLKKIPLTSRFDYNYITLNDIESFQDKLVKSNIDFGKPDSKETIASLTDIIKQTILKTIVKSTTNIDSLNARFKRSQKRVVVSATSAEKISSFKIEDAFLLYNGTFICVPVLTNVVTKKDEGESKGLIYWFRINVNNVQTWEGITPKPEEIALDLVKFATASSISVNSKLSTKEELQIPLDTRAVQSFPEKAIEMAMGMEEFKLRGTLQKVDPFIALDIGDREGVYLDQGYEIYEMRLGKDNKKYSEYVGFARVSEVGKNTDNIENDSKLFGIIGSYEQYNTAVSHDQFLDIYIKPTFNIVTIPQHSGFFLELITGQPIMEADANSSVNFQLGAYMNLAKYLGVSQMFAGLSVDFGLPTVVPNPDIAGNFTINPPFTYGANINVMKKIWFSRFNVYAEMQFGFNSFKLTGTLNEKDWEINTGFNYGAGLNVGFEYAINPDMNLSLEAGYRYVLPVVSITLIDIDGKTYEYLKEDNKLFWEYSEYDNLNMGGLKFGMKFTYSVPPLFELFDINF